jgi:hypothetical protein
LVDAFALNSATPIFSTTKAVSDLQLILDSITQDLAKTIGDLLTVSDVTALSVSKPVSDLYAVSDTPALHPSNFAFDSVSVLSAVQSIGVQKVSVDIQSVTDLSSLSLLQSQFDTASVTDLDTWSLVAIKNDSFGLDDVVLQVRNYVRQLNDAFALNDSADVGEGINVQTIKTFSNVAFLSDALINTLALSKFEALSTSDAGSLVSQGYCDLAYFADDYVGATRSF